MKRLAVFASGRGSNFKAIVDHARLGVLQDIEVSLLVTNDPMAPVAAVAREASVPYSAIEGVYGKKFATKQEKEKARNQFDLNAAELLNQYEVDFVALAGFMQVLGPTIVASYRYRIMNIHPAIDLLRFGGAGMFGERVHAAVLQAGEKNSGCTIHYVDESVDGGPILLQSIVPVASDDTPESLAARILVQEHQTYSKALQLHADGRITVREGKAVVDWSAAWEERWNRRQEAFIQYQTQAASMQERMLKPRA